MLTVILASEDHPNKHPFSIKLFPVDQASDGAPLGAQGKRLLIPQLVAERTLHTLEGMAVNAKPDLSGHSPQHKIGVITSTRVVDGWAEADGHFYAYDHPDTIKELHALAQLGQLGASLEATHTFAADQDGVLTVTSLVFTGATVMLREQAAWKSTSVAAQTENPSPMSDPVTVPATPAAPAPDAEALTRLLSVMAQGQEALVSAMGALTEKVGALQAAATPAPSAAPAEPATPPSDPKLAALEAKLTELEGKLTASEDRLKKLAPARKTLTAGQQLAGKFDVKASDDPLTAINDLRAKGTIDTTESFALKIQARMKASDTTAE